MFETDCSDRKTEQIRDLNNFSHLMQPQVRNANPGIHEFDIFALIQAVPELQAKYKEFQNFLEAQEIVPMGDELLDTRKKEDKNTDSDQNVEEDATKQKKDPIMGLNEKSGCDGMAHSSTESSRSNKKTTEIDAELSEDVDESRELASKSAEPIDKNAGLHKTSHQFRLLRIQ
ncbi:hypothetical protein GCK72_024943 [Caenorhabditis remanei]|uniref:Uncharacterized protein n=1 Tax=Caenorhabditis remanei TaxID=31234 RepID=A0A6A5G0K6_CAERE|nr:hypothetical protein GCK72_024943 [Caenorhabditis remanei]KAF1748476.1 hypothetical protein GCK72_024943 [Caenorhabditis remanei]